MAQTDTAGQAMETGASTNRYSATPLLKVTAKVISVTLTIVEVTMVGGEMAVGPSN